MKRCRCNWLFALVIGTIAVATATADYDTPDQQEIQGPMISPNSNEIILQKGDNFTITCKGKRPIHIKQQDIPEESLGMFKMEERNLTSDSIEYPFAVALDLYNVDQYAVGYYACVEDKIDSNAVLNDLMDEPSNNAHVTYTYIYVNGTDVLFAPLSEYFIILNGSQTLLRCRPTMPDTDITITLNLVGVIHHIPDYNYEKYDPKVGITLYKDELPDDVVFFECDAWRRYDNKRDNKQFIVKQEVKGSPDVTIDDSPKFFLAGENFTLNCSAQYQPNFAIALSWNLPQSSPKVKIINSTNELTFKAGEKLYNAITIINATKECAGNYTCIIKTGLGQRGQKTAQKIYLDEPYIILKKTFDYNQPRGLGLKKAIFNTEIDAYPAPILTWYREHVMIKNGTKYKSYTENMTNDNILEIRNFTVYDTANYTLVANNGYLEKNITYELRKFAKPIVLLTPEKNIISLQNSTQTLVCEAIGYPLPNIEWILSDSNNESSVTERGNITKTFEYKLVSEYNLNAVSSGNIKCTAENKWGHDSQSRNVSIYEINNGFGISNPKHWYPENHKVSMKCLASIYHFNNSTWLGPDGEELKTFVKYSSSQFSHVATLKIDHVSIDQNGTYTCFVTYLNGSTNFEDITIEVEAQREPNITEPLTDQDEYVTTFQPVEFSCVAEAVPLPNIDWYKDGLKLPNDTDGLIIYERRNHTVINSTVVIERMKEENKGKYECLANSDGNIKSKFFNLIMQDSSAFRSSIVGAVSVIVLLLLILVVYLTWKIRKEKRFRKELAAAGLLYFKEGVTKSLNPDLGIDEQAELLPYDEKFEFPPDRLILGKQLGAGAFGVVYKADARGIINAEETTPVAVKMVKKTADNMYIKALASELKIMVHLGKHVNIVNLLGACTKNVGKRELIVIVEYCKFGNIHNYIQKHREVFIDQLTDNKEKNLGRVNRGYSCSSASSGVNSDYFGTNHTQATDHTFVNSANTNRSGRKVSETGYVQPEWRSNYESDYSFDGRSPRPLCSRDLLAWSFQIARGMEYLASRKVLHGDLAARNVLLADDNIVKICDFGLARSIYKNDEYQKKENSPLPVKWLAIECMTDRIFSTQSDVWSFGIVLWEMFSLAKTPYPNMSPQHLLQWLTEGHRLEKPSFADDRLHDVMKRCWEHKPTMRPTFTQLQELLGSFLEDNVRNHYVDLNSPYMALNAKCVGQEDYLTMVSAPDYKNLVTPSPHHYMNDVTSFFPPTPTQAVPNEAGYLPMTPSKQIFSPRSQSTKFDFDARNLDPRVTDGGSELTPMLTLNNLPRSGSDSDHEPGHSPYLNMTRIAEETDDVFRPHANNFKNIQNSAVSNPTYITFDVDIEKKPQDINTYVNIPNGLVK